LIPDSTQRRDGCPSNLVALTRVPSPRRCRPAALRPRHRSGWTPNAQCA